MEKTTSILLRLSPVHAKLLAALVEKTGLDRTNVIRFALVRLADAEGIQMKKEK